MRMAKLSIYFLIGGLLYTGLELCWRGWTHGSMFLLGGLCFVLLEQIGKSRWPFWMQMLLGMGTITALEFLSGLLINRFLGLAVWDYSDRRFQLLGQICLGYSLLWLPVSGMGLLCARGMGRLMGDAPHPIRWV